LFVKGTEISATDTEVQGTYGKLYVDPDGSWDYDLEDNAMHPLPGVTGPADTIPGESFSIEVKVSNVTIASSSLTIDITDDGPVIGDPVDAFLTNAPSALIENVDLDIDFGADGPYAGPDPQPIQLEGPTAQDGGDPTWYAVDNNEAFLTSEGTKLVYGDDGNGGLIAYKVGTTDAVFTVSVNSDATYNVEIVGILDGAITPFTVDLPGTHTGGNLQAREFYTDTDDDGDFDITITATAATSTHPLGTADVNFNAHSIGVNNANDIAGDYGDLLHLEFTNYDTGFYETFDKMNVTFEHFDGSSETAYVQAYIHEGAVLTPVGSLIELSGPGLTFEIDPDVEGDFDTLELTAATGTKYKLAAVGGIEYEEGVDHIVTYDVTATDGDLDPDSDVFDVAFDDGDGVLDGATEGLDTLVPEPGDEDPTT
jgi:VCBS repeat-containing protein